MKTIDQINFKNKKTLVRVDYNVPLNEKGEVEGTMRIDRTVPTIKKIVNDGGIAILMSHLGRPKGSVVPEMSLHHITSAVSEIMGQDVYFLGDVLDEKVEEKINALKPGSIGILENIRFHKEETDGDIEFAKRIASLGDLYVNDAFGAAHRAHASTA
ncbi:MAG: phosphoglycerate kinase, partial [Bacteroidales bacterium]|nr:phosphoglycerate kinase [Bacteroidales bacterium]